jgi:peptidoglycan-N-acetylmuramic acid deacetylase
MAIAGCTRPRSPGSVIPTVTPTLDPITAATPTFTHIIRASSASASASASASTTARTIPIDPGPAPLPEYNVKLGVPPPFVQSLPGSDRTVALTIDDGVDSAVVKAYLDFVESSGVRLTFFVNGINDSWTNNAAQLRPLIESGQVQVGNHTWSHPDLTKLSSSEIVDELRRNERFLNNTYGVTARPFLRPPYGFYNDHVQQIATDQGLTTITMWYGSFGDSALISESALLSLERQWLGVRRIVIGHANHPTVTHLYPQILDLIRDRALTTVTLDDAFYGAAGRKKAV